MSEEDSDDTNNLINDFQEAMVDYSDAILRMEEILRQENEINQLIRDIDFYVLDIEDRDFNQAVSESLMDCHMKRNTRVKVDGNIKIHNSSKDNCVICMENFEVECETYNLICNHMFHKNCLDEWVKWKQLCPVCNKVLNTTYCPNIDDINENNEDSLSDLEFTDSSSSSSSIFLEGE